MMADVDAITRHFGKNLSKYLEIGAIIIEIDQLSRPKAYAAAIFLSKND